MQECENKLDFIKSQLVCLLPTSFQCEGVNYNEVKLKGAIIFSQNDDSYEILFDFEENYGLRLLKNDEWVTQFPIESLKESSLRNYVDRIAKAMTPDIVVKKFIVKDESGEMLSFFHHIGQEYDTYEEAEDAIHSFLLKQPLGCYSIHKIYKANQ